MSGDRVPAMIGMGIPELLIAFVLGLLVPIVVGYWVIRLAVRHGVMDAHRRLPGTGVDRGSGAPLS